MKLPFLGGAYAGRSKSVNPERCTNFYLESHGDGFHLVGTPGLTRRLTLDYGTVRGLYFFDSRIYAVAGAHVFSITSGHVASDLGTIGTSFGRVSIADNGSSMVLIDGSATGYVIAGGILSAIADVDFEGGTSITYQDGYFIVTIPDSSRFRLSDLNSAISWIDTDFADAEGAPDKIRAVISDLRQLWLLGVQTGEVWDNAGDADFPFVRNPSGFFHKGIAAPATLCHFDNSLVWLSEDDRGYGLLVQANGYTPQIIVPQAISWQWSRYSRIDDAFAYTYQVEGHEFYVLTFPTGNATWVYDARDKQWHRWSSNIDGDEESRHRGNCHCFAFGRHYVGDYNSGKIYTIEPDVYTEDGTTIIRDRICQNVEAEKKFSVDEIEIEIEAGNGLVTGQGSDPQLMLRTSKDDGNRWSNEMWRSAGKQGEHGRRAVWRKQGRSRGRTLWLRVSDPIKWIITGARGRSRDFDEDKAA
jgi:hypothetical protein